MGNTKKLILKIIAAIVAIALIGGVLFVTNAFVGNPISAMMANKAIKKYVVQNYSYLDLDIEKSSYNFKDGSYMARAKSRTSIDTKFYVYYRSGKVHRDEYESHVLGMFNTLERLSGEYSAIAKKIIAEELGYENNTTMVMYEKAMYENAKDIVELDMKFTKEIPMDPEVIIRLDLEDTSLEVIAKVLTDAHRAFINNDCNFNKYSMYAENNGMLVMINEVTPADIESGELVSLLEKGKDNKGSSGIYVLIKDENK